MLSGGTVYDCFVFFVWEWNFCVEPVCEKVYLISRGSPLVCDATFDVKII